MKHFITIVFISILLLCEQSVFAQSLQSDSLFSLGVSLYQKGEFEAAIKVFMQCDSLDYSDDRLIENRKVYSKIWIASSYYKLGQVDSAISISPKYFKYVPVDRSKTVITDSLSSIATVLFEKEDYKEALEVLKTCANIERDSLGANSLWYKNTITECGYLCYNIGNYDEAIKYGIIANDISMQVCGSNSDEHIESLTNLINYFGEINDDETVKKYLKELESIKNDVVYDDKNGFADALMELAGYYEALGDYEEAVRLITKANDVADQDPEAKGVRNYFLFEDLIHLQQYKKAIIVGQESIKSFEERISPSDSTYSALGVLYTRLADCFSNIGNFIKAVDLCQQAIHIYDSSEDKNNAPQKISSLNLLSSCFNDLGLYEDAIKTELEAIEIMKSMEEFDSLKYAIELSNLAFYHSKLGNNVDAYILCEDAYNIVQKLEVSMDDPDLLLIFSNLASHYADLGNYSKAVELNKLVLSIRSQTVGKGSFEYATSLNNLATYLSYTEDYVLEDVISLQKESLDIIESVYGKANQYYIESLTNLAVLNDIGKSPKLSLELLNEALLLTDSLFPEKDHPSKILIYYNIANVYNGLKQFDKALDNLQKAFSIMNLYGLEDNQEYIKIKKGLYYSYLKSNNISEAIKWMRETYQSVYCQVVDNFPRLSSREREMFWSIYSEWFYDDLPHLLQYDSSEETVKTLYNSSLLSKGILLSTNIYIDKLLEEENPSLLIELHRLRQTQKILEMADRKELKMNPDSILYSKETAERNLLNGSQVYNGLRNYFKINFQNIRDVLDEKDLAIEFVTMPTDSNEVYYALCLKQDYEAPHIIRLFDFSYKTSNSLTSKNSPKSLSLTIWEKLKEELLGVEDIYFSPTGELHKIGIEYTSGIEKYNLYRLSSTRNIIELKANSKSDEINTISAILYGGIDYESKNSTISDITGHFYSQDRISTLLSQSQHRAFIDSLDLRGLKIHYLPGTLKEVQNIKKIIDEKQYDAIIFSGSEATETTMKSLSLHTPQILHIATHGFYFTEDRAKKEDIGRFVVNHELKNSSIEDKSLSRSGVLFAGANLTINGQDVPMDADDGILTAQEVSQLDLRGIDLVVLSACDTGTGDIKQGEGVFGLQRGFKKAGARSILMSLWKVSDIATELLMTEFYKTLCEGKTKRESLRRAQKKVQNYKDPDGNLLFQDSHFWAGFILLD